MSNELYKIIIEGVSTDPGKRVVAYEILVNALKKPVQEIEAIFAGGNHIGIAGTFQIDKANQLLDRLSGKGIFARVELAEPLQPPGSIIEEAPKAQPAVPPTEAKKQIPPELSTTRAQVPSEPEQLQPAGQATETSELEQLPDGEESEEQQDIDFEEIPPPGKIYPPRIFRLKPAFRIIGIICVIILGLIAFFLIGILKSFGTSLILIIFFMIYACLIIKALKSRIVLTGNHIQIFRLLKEYKYHFDDIRWVGVRGSKSSFFFAAMGIIFSDVGEKLSIGFGLGQTFEKSIDIYENRDRLLSTLTQHAINAYPGYEDDIEVTCTTEIPEIWQKSVVKARIEKQLPSTTEIPPEYVRTVESSLKGPFKFLALPAFAMAYKPAISNFIILLLTLTALILSIWAYPAMRNPYPRLVTVENILDSGKRQGLYYVALIDGLDDYYRNGDYSSGNLKSGPRRIQGYNRIFFPVISPSDAQYPLMHEKYEKIIHEEVGSPVWDNIVHEILIHKPSRYVTVWVENGSPGKRMSSGNVRTMTENGFLDVSSEQLWVGLLKNNSGSEKRFFSIEYYTDPPKAKILVGKEPFYGTIAPFYIFTAISLWLLLSILIVLLVGSPMVFKSEEYHYEAPPEPPEPLEPLPEEDSGQPEPEPQPEEDTGPVPFETVETAEDFVDDTPESLPDMPPLPPDFELPDENS